MKIFLMSFESLGAASWLAAGLCSAASTWAGTIAVGPTREVRTLGEAARLARDGDTVLVDAGIYRRDVAVWTQNRLALRAVGGRVRLVADGAAAEAKAIWVVRGGAVTVEGFDFEGARVEGRNGAGIRFERGALTVRDCSFMHNEMGMLTGNDVESSLSVEDSEFAHNQRPDGHNHNLYVGTIARFRISGSYLHDAQRGHLLKSRAALNHVLYNRLTDESGQASYELEFPNGGVAYVVGNVVEQAPGTDNLHVVSYGAEGYRWGDNRLYLAHNTLIDQRVPPGVFLRVSPGASSVQVLNNLLVGAARWDAGAGALLRGNVTVAAAELDADHAWRHTAPAVEPAGAVDGQRLQPDRAYAHPRRTVALESPWTHPGAASPRQPHPR